MDRADELASGQRSSWSGVSVPVSTVTRPPSAAKRASWSQVLLQVSQPSPATCKMTSVSRTRHPGRRVRSGPVMVLMPVPLAPLRTNSGRAGSHESAPQRGQRRRCARGRRPGSSRGRSSCRRARVVSPAGSCQHRVNDTAAAAGQPPAAIVGLSGSPVTGPPRTFDDFGASNGQRPRTPPGRSSTRSN